MKFKKYLDEAQIRYFTVGVIGLAYLNLFYGIIRFLLGQVSTAEDWLNIILHLIFVLVTTFIIVKEYKEFSKEKGK